MNQEFSLIIFEIILISIGTILFIIAIFLDGFFGYCILMNSILAISCAYLVRELGK